MKKIENYLKKYIDTHYLTVDEKVVKELASQGEVCDKEIFLIKLGDGGYVIHFAKDLEDIAQEESVEVSDYDALEPSKVYKIKNFYLLVFDDDVLLVDDVLNDLQEGQVKDFFNI